MCVLFHCEGCDVTFTNHCEDQPAESTGNADGSESDSVAGDNKDGADADDPEITESAENEQIESLADEDDCPNLTFRTDIAYCETCVCINRVIAKLEYLVFRAPFLSTDGLSGLEKVPSWERKDLERLFWGRKSDWNAEADSQEERRRIQKRIEKMGLDGVADEREAHQGFDVSVTPVEVDSKESTPELVW